ncbi:MAG TPA: alanine racemase [Bosea sp. (in: a-proteobacteria)]|jgi:D-serine dehydratase|uniref:alanine racemase n=1 Tax=Bosea sp. (in: a-proteobacteria) TaxID=1871050 RepID=UPI002E1359A2|nr:alanine racemase [Bosea sp. (in: a-proteobacteria)]
MAVTASAALPRLSLKEIEDQRLDALSKGMPPGRAVWLGDVGKQGWSLLAGDMPMPLAVIRESVLKANSAWMSAFTKANDLLIAPHGKTTMAPQLFDLQIADGAWAITVATMQQLAVARYFGVKRVILANQPVGAQEIAACFDALEDPGFEFYCLADSAAGVALLARSAQARGGSNPLRILVEIGFTGGRTGARTREEALEVSRAVAASPGLQLCGFECFEGLHSDTAKADGLLGEVVAVAAAAEAEGLLGPQAMILSAGGTSLFDRVGEVFNAATFTRPVVKVLRSGCYLTHDSTAYSAAFSRITLETNLKLPPGGLEPALEVWAYVQSRPERGRSLLTLGKRDISYDAGLPVPLRWFRPGAMTLPATMPPGHTVLALNDQHCHLGTPEESPLQIGDMVAFGIGHPCTTFDKWSVLMLIDDECRVTGAIRTFF